MSDLSKTVFCDNDLKPLDSTNDMFNTVAELEEKLNQEAVDWFQVIDSMTPELREILGQMLYAYSANEAAKDY